ncbi:MAG: Chalcone and stilbene synthase-like protein [Bryobacterales bacterium]|jgi:alkylresorcinol/alkylpyrone synthase|nr:Chalcone and stilbene synthase-like protein [Bryobacterales bacterium]
MKIVSAASAFPKHYYPQPVLLAALRQYWGGKLDDPRVLDRLHEHVGVEGRHLALPLESYLGLNTWGKANDAWIEAAEETGQQAICRALSQAGLAATDPGALFFISITGIASPSIDARLINRMGLSPNIRRIPIFGLGCVGGAAGIARAADYVRAYPDQTAIVLAAEFCSLTLQRDDLSVANLISSGLFGDGAAAVIISGGEVDLPGPEILATRSIFYPDTEQVMGWDISEEGFRIVLSREVPAMVRKHLAPDVDEFLADNGLNRRDIGSWIMHTGGPAVLQAIEQVFDLQNGELGASWDSLRNTGNLSSASVLVVLEEVMRRRRPEPGTLSILAAMGPGFCSELVLLRW